MPDCNLDSILDIPCNVCLSEKKNLVCEPEFGEQLTEWLFEEANRT
jgi:hypothetical protein